MSITLPATGRTGQGRGGWREGEKFWEIRRRRARQTGCGNQAQKPRFEVQSLTPCPSASHPIWSDPPASSHGTTTESVWEEGTLWWSGGLRWGPAEQNTMRLMTEPFVENRARAVSKFSQTLGVSAARHERDAWQTYYLPVSIAIYDWPALVPVTSRCLGRQGWPIKSQRSAESLLLLLSFNWTWFA